VVWTDVFQCILILSTYFTIILYALIYRKGISEILEAAGSGGKLNFFDEPFDTVTTYTPINTAIIFMLLNLLDYSTSPAHIQRYLSIRDKKQVKATVLLNAPAVML